MASLSGSVREDEEMQEASGIVLFLPRKIHLCARFTGPNVLHELLDCLLYLVHCGRLHLIRKWKEQNVAEITYAKVDEVKCL